MLKVVQNFLRTPLTSSINILRPSSTILSQNSFESSWFSELKPKEKDEIKKSCEKYDPYPNYDFYTPSPYKNEPGIRKFYESKMFSSGVLPRPSGDFEDKPLPMPVYSLKDHAWTEKKALFGQNDYIDILGDGTVHPWELTKGPGWLKGFNGNEFMRLLRRLAFEGESLKEFFPSKYHQIVKQIRFLYAKVNRRKKSSRWGGKRRYSRIDKPRERY